MTNSGWTRRTFLKTGSAAAMGVALGVPGTHHRQPVWFQRQAVAGKATLNDPRVKALLASALDAARTAGAQYAEASATYDKDMNFRFSGGRWPPVCTEVLGINVRAMVEGRWGFSASAVLGPDEAPRLGRQAVQLAKSLVVPNAPRPFTWAPAPRVEDGVWSTPIEIDPFEMPIEELSDFIEGVETYKSNVAGGMGVSLFGSGFMEPGGTGWELVFNKQEHLFASTEGSHIFQTRYVSGGKFILTVQGYGSASLPNFGVEAAGWEYVRDARLADSVQGLIEKAMKGEGEGLPSRPLAIGRYDVVFSASAMMQLLHATLGPATQLDRALGYEANAGGTSYLGPDPLAFLGTPVASPLVHVSANRSMPRGLGTVKWDHEGVAPEDFDLVREGVLVDYQTTREQAAWIAPWYEKQGRPLRSHGCADAESALYLPTQHTPNLQLHPGSGEETVESLAAGIEKGIIVQWLGGIMMDQQSLNGAMGVGGITQVRGGKPVGTSPPRGMVFRSPELWKGVIGLGGPKSQQQTRALNLSEKGEPSQKRPYTISAVPAVVKQLAIIDLTRKA